MAKPPPPLSAWSPVVREILFEQLKQNQNPIDWIGLNKTLMFAHEQAKSKFPRVRNEEIYNVLMQHLTAQIHQDYQTGVQGLRKRCGWFQRKRKNLV